MSGENLRITIEKKQHILLGYFLLAALGGLISLWILLMIPADTKTAWMFGFSRSRILMLSVLSLGVLFFLGVAAAAWLRKSWLEKSAGYIDTLLKKEIVGAGLWGFSAVGFLVGVFLAGNASPQPDFIIYAYFLRFLPFAIWFAWLCMLNLAVFFLWGYRSKVFMNRSLSVAALWLAPIFLLVFFAVFSIDLNYYREITKEDQLVEWLTVIFLGLGSAVSFFLAFRKDTKPKIHRYFLIGFALFCIFASLEEISWAQRVFNVESTQFFLENSDQQEINAHNVFQKWYGIRTTHIAAFVLFSYGVLLPMLTRLFQPVRSLVEKLGITIPAMLLSPSFVLGAVLMTKFFSGQAEEIGELVFGACLFLVVFLELIDVQPGVEKAP